MTTWLVDSQRILQILLSDKCIAAVDGSFFPEHPEYISAYWKFIYDRKIIGQGGFVVKSHPCIQSARAAEVCGGLGALATIDHILIDHHMRKINLTLGSNCQSAIHIFNTRQRIVSFNSKISEVVREILQIKRLHLNNLVTEKIAGHQEKVKKVNESSFMEFINIQCDPEAKALIREQISSAGSPTLPF